MALKHSTETLPSERGTWCDHVWKQTPTSRRVREGRSEANGRPEVERPLVQILVVVANIQVESLKAEAGEGFHVNSKWTWVSRT